MPAMVKARLLGALGSVLLAAGSCAPTLTLFVVPSQIWAGQAFEISVHGSENSMTTGVVGCILQVPNSFTVLGAESSLSLVSIFNPLVGGLAPEPGHYLVRFSGFSSLPNGSLQVFVRAPSAPSGPFAFKVVLTGSGLAVSDPPNFTSFASLTAANFVKTASVVAAPTPLFVLDIEGLVASGALSGRGITL